MGEAKRRKAHVAAGGKDWGRPGHRSLGRRGEKEALLDLIEKRRQQSAALEAAGRA
jgi:hypothetical protein